MEIKEIIAELVQVSHTFPRDAINEAITHKFEMIPALLSLIDDPARLFTTCKARPDYMGHIYAFFLLAQFRVTGAYAPLLRIFGYPSDQVNLLGWDFITEDLARITASVCDGDLTPIQRMIEDPAVDEYVRESMLKSLLILVTYNKMPREQLVDYCASLLREKLERSPSAVWFGLVITCAELADHGLMGAIETAYADGLIDPGDITQEEVEEGMARGWDRNLARTLKELEYGLVEDTVREMEWWAYFQEEQYQDSDHRAFRDIDFTRGTQVPEKPRISFQRKHLAPHKVGRNQPCPCGSGKKYKVCCGKKKAHQESP